MSELQDREIVANLRQNSSEVLEAVEDAHDCRVEVDIRKPRALRLTEEDDVTEGENVCDAVRSCTSGMNICMYSCIVNMECERLRTCRTSGSEHRVDFNIVQPQQIVRRNLLVALMLVEQKTKIEP